MNLRRFDLPLQQSAASRFLPWTIGGLLYLAVVALAVAGVADEALRLYGVRTKLVTVSLPSIEDAGRGERRDGRGDRDAERDRGRDLGGSGAARGARGPGGALARHGQGERGPAASEADRRDLGSSGEAGSAGAASAAGRGDPGRDHRRRSLVPRSCRAAGGCSSGRGAAASGSRRCWACSLSSG